MGDALESAAAHAHLYRTPRAVLPVIGCRKWNNSGYFKQGHVESTLTFSLPRQPHGNHVRMKSLQSSFTPGHPFWMQKPLSHCQGWVSNRKGPGVIPNLQNQKSLNSHSQRKTFSRGKNETHAPVASTLNQNLGAPWCAEDTKLRVRFSAPGTRPVATGSGFQTGSAERVASQYMTWKERSVRTSRMLVQW